MNFKDKKTYIGAAVVVVLVGLLVYHLATRHERGGGEYIFDRSRDIKLADIKKYLQKVEFTDDLVKEYFSRKTANPYTVQFFNSLQKKFQSEDFEEHLEQVRQYLYSVLDQQEAGQLFALYRNYVNYQKDLNKQIAQWGAPGSPQEALKFLRDLQSFRRDYFGQETADSLFGVDIKAKEYPIRRGMIVNDANLYAADKLAQINKLNADMWGDEAGDVEQYEKPYTRYKERFLIYQKDMGEMTDAQKNEKIAEFRKEVFSDEVIARLGEMDEFLADETAREAQYRAEEQKIMKNQELSAQDKQDRLKEAQDTIFGDDADAFRRRENIKKAAENH